MHSLGRVCFQKVVHQAIQQHGPSLFKDNMKDILELVCFSKREYANKTLNQEIPTRAELL